MLRFTVFYRSADRRRIESRELYAPDVDNATGDAIESIEHFFGAGAAWFVAAIVQTDCIAEVGATIEASL